eukprot:CAMPEP_0205802800 /NCGR_PEP_ID=MMETSP0205-20121125/5254_1 /ASSEMBLY_ACC=CAM_ASM_000278 /TAXON_ID=36767 /ORGANISM="Euplotes focardii, Strain TN1" /LENGTH=62 /DNA_ID=CAMNT_0053069841 /DNA_START=1438 /DNA_END=1623 /DNA_ORIENTATION=-
MQVEEKDEKEMKEKVEELEDDIRIYQILEKIEEVQDSKNIDVREKAQGLLNNYLNYNSYDPQ